MTPAERVTRDALVDTLEFELGVVESGVARWAVDPLDGPQVTFLNIPSFQPLATVEDGEALLARWREMGPWIDRHVAGLRASARDGLVAPRALVDSVVAELDDLLARPDDAWPLARPSTADPPGWSGTERDRFAAAIGAAIRDDIRPAFERQRAYLADELAPIARPDDRAGLGHVPGGEAAYAHLVAAHTTVDLDPSAIHAIGLEEVDRIDAEFAELGGQLLGTSTHRRDPRPAAPRSVAPVHDPRRGPRDRRGIAATGERGDPGLVRAAARRALRGRRHGRPRVGPLDDRLLPPARRRRQPPGQLLHQHRRCPRRGRATRPRHSPSTRPSRATTSSSRSPRSWTDLPAFRRFGGPTAFVEGWGLYTERLADEMGLYSGPLDRFGVLSFDAWRACRLVVDTGMHALGWSRGQAIDFMLAHTALGENNVVNEVGRYLALPGQALAYKIGQREFLALRAEAEDALGSAFDIRAFHDAALGEGTVGLRTLRGVIEAWIAQTSG